MVKATYVFLAQGDAFSPTAAARATGVAFTRSNEPGDLGTKGNYLGQPRPYGSAELEGPAEADLEVPHAATFAAVECLAPACVAAGADSLRLHIDVAYVDQCNLELGPAFVEALARLGIAITLTCFEAD